MEGRGIHCDFELGAGYNFVSIFHIYARRFRKIPIDLFMSSESIKTMSINVKHGYLELYFSTTLLLPALSQTEREWEAHARTYVCTHTIPALPNSCIAVNNYFFKKANLMRTRCFKVALVNFNICGIVAFEQEWELSNEKYHRVIQFKHTLNVRVAPI